MYQHNNIYVSCFLLGLFGLIVFSCQSDSNYSDQYDPDFDYGVDTVIAVTLSPAGANVAYKYDFKEKQLLNSPDTSVYIPYPVNIGFLHQNVNNSNEDVERLPVIIIGKQLPQLQPIGVKVIGVVEMQKHERSEVYVLTIPNDQKLTSIEIDNFADLITTQDAFKYQLQHFLQNYQGSDDVSSIRWYDEKYANQLISKSKSVAD